MHAKYWRSEACKEDWLNLLRDKEGRNKPIFFDYDVADPKKVLDVFADEIKKTLNVDL